MLAGDMVISHDIFGHFMLIQVFKAMVFVFFRHLFLIILLFILLLIFGLLSKSRFFALILQLNKLGQKFLSVRVNLLLDLLNCKIVLEINFTLLLLELAKVFEFLFVKWCFNWSIIKLLPMLVLFLHFFQLGLNLVFLRSWVGVLWPLWDWKVFIFVLGLDLAWNFVKLICFESWSLRFTQRLSRLGDGGQDVLGGVIDALRSQGHVQVGVLVDH